MKDFDHCPWCASKLAGGADESAENFKFWAFDCGAQIVYYRDLDEAVPAKPCGTMEVIARAAIKTAGDLGVKLRASVVEAAEQPAERKRGHQTWGGHPSGPRAQIDATDGAAIADHIGDVELEMLARLGQNAPSYPLEFDKQSGSRFMNNNASAFYEACWNVFNDDGIPHASPSPSLRASSGVTEAEEAHFKDCLEVALIERDAFRAGYYAAIRADDPVGARRQVSDATIINILHECDRAEARRIDGALTSIRMTPTLARELCAALESAALSAEPGKPSKAVQDYAVLHHLSNEWADMATNGIQWLRNIRDGIATPGDAIVEMETNLNRIYALRDAGKPPIPSKFSCDASLSAEWRATQAAQDVLAERRRQVEAEGWTPEHDDGHSSGQIALAAAAYADHSARFADAARLGLNYKTVASNPLWPWERRWWKPTNPRGDLVKAGALILAEIERLDRAALPSRPEKSDGKETK